MDGGERNTATQVSTIVAAEAVSREAQLFVARAQARQAQARQRSAAQLGLASAPIGSDNAGGPAGCAEPSLGGKCATHRVDGVPADGSLCHALGAACSWFFHAPVTGEEMLRQCIHWVVIGDVLHPQKPASRVVTCLKNAGKTVTLVNPRDTANTEVHKSLRQASEASSDPIEVISLIINPYDGLEQMRQAAEVGITNVFIQPGAASVDILAFCDDHNISVHEGCVLVEVGCACLAQCR